MAAAGRPPSYCRRASSPRELDLVALRNCIDCRLVLLRGIRGGPLTGMAVPFRSNPFSLSCIAPFQPRAGVLYEKSLAGVSPWLDCLGGGLFSVAGELCCDCVRPRTRICLFLHGPALSPSFYRIRLRRDDL